MNWDTKLKESGQDLCFLTTFQLIEDFRKYERQFRSEFIKAKSESQVESILKERHGQDLVKVERIELTGYWTDFESDMKRTFQGD